MELERPIPQAFLSALDPVERISKCTTIDFLSLAPVLPWNGAVRGSGPVMACTNFTHQNKFKYNIFLKRSNPVKQVFVGSNLFLQIKDQIFKAWQPAGWGGRGGERDKGKYTAGTGQNRRERFSVHFIQGSGKVNFLYFLCRYYNIHAFVTTFLGWLHEETSEYKRKSHAHHV